MNSVANGKILKTELRELAKRLRDSVAFPLGDDLADVAMDPRGNALHEFTDDTYVVWSNFQDDCARLISGSWLPAGKAMRILSPSFIGHPATVR